MCVGKFSDEGNIYYNNESGMCADHGCGWAMKKVKRERRGPVCREGVGEWMEYGKQVLTQWFFHKSKLNFCHSAINLNTRI